MYSLLIDTHIAYFLMPIFYFGVPCCLRTPSLEAHIAEHVWHGSPCRQDTRDPTGPDPTGPKRHSNCYPKGSNSYSIGHQYNFLPDGETHKHVCLSFFLYI